VRTGRAARIERSDSGSVLLEAVTGVSLLTVLATSLATFHSVALATDVRAQARLQALSAAEQALEGQLAGIVTPDDGHDIAIVRLPIDGDPCAHHELAGLGRLRVRVPVIASGSVVEETIEVAGVHLASAPITTGVLVRLTGEGHLGAPAIATLDVGPDGTGGVSGEIGPTIAGDTSPSGCVAVMSLSDGRHELKIDDGAGPQLVDRLHRAAADAPLPVSTLGGVVRRSWDVRAAALLTVHADASGARLPDTVGAGSLAWLVREDDVRVATPLGSARFVHSGSITVVVSACVNAEAPATARTIVVTGDAATVHVPLATVVVRNVAAHPDATLHLVRTTGCGDGAVFRPTLDWNGGLHEGMRIALPHGEWEARLQTTSGSRITGTVLVRTDGSDAEVVLP
jgi:hypothetical protein